MTNSRVVLDDRLKLNLNVGLCEMAALIDHECDGRIEIHHFLSDQDIRNIPDLKEVQKQPPLLFTLCSRAHEKLATTKQGQRALIGLSCEEYGREVVWALLVQHPHPEFHLEAFEEPDYEQVG